jgi:hypothetical protein
VTVDVIQLMKERSLKKKLKRSRKDNEIEVGK